MWIVSRIPHAKRAAKKWKGIHEVTSHQSDPLPAMPDTSRPNHHRMGTSVRTVPAITIAFHDPARSRKSREMDANTWKKVKKPMRQMKVNRTRLDDKESTSKTRRPTWSIRYRTMNVTIPRGSRVSVMPPS